MSRKLVQMANLDADTLLAFLHDNSLLNSVLLDAGIDTPGDRLKIILTLKTMADSRLAPTSAPLPVTSESNNNTTTTKITTNKKKQKKILPQK